MVNDDREIHEEKKREIIVKQKVKMKRIIVDDKGEIFSSEDLMVNDEV